jgi:hypothetical protein
MELKNIQSSAAGTSHKLTAPAKTPVETEILAGLKISLRASQ